MYLWCEKFNKDIVSIASCCICFNSECAHNCNKDIEEVVTNTKLINKDN